MKLKPLCSGEEETEFIQTDNGIFDHNLFGLTWGPSVAALSYIFDKVILYTKALRAYICVNILIYING